MDKINRVVVRGTNWVGDAVMTIPALRELRRLLPDAYITLATSDWAKELFSQADYLDDLLIQDNRSVFKNSRQWRKHNFDLAVIFPNSFASALVPFLARVPFRIGYSSDRRKVLLTHAVPLPEWRSSKHEIFYYLNIVSEVGRLLGSESVVHDPDISLQISEQSRQLGRELLHATGCNDAQRVIALCPGSINSRAKRWPAERYAKLADDLIETLHAQVVLVGSKEELDVSVEVGRHMRNEPIVMTGKTTLAQAVAVLSNVDLLITNDTGPAHIASSLGRPTLVIFGPTNPLTTRPYSATSEIVRHPPDCAPCMLRDCPIDHRCMTAITPEAVFERACVMLSDKLQYVAPQNNDKLACRTTTIR
ncbi:MAG TPA: lipopolysaccharide heptosyltransferase II [Pyrinomonadaceae bacterium]|nr:lipopolysaccharide heptosyltransferase II [Pyrinomonadaceae bacterium]